MKSLRTYFRILLPSIVVLLSMYGAHVVHAAGNDISITAATSSDHNVQLTGTLPAVPFDASTYTWQWYSQGAQDSTGTLLTNANGGPATTSSIDTTTQTAADGTYCDTITALATSPDGTDHHTGSTTIGVTWANGDATVQSTCASAAAPTTSTASGSGTSPSTPTSSTANCGSDSQICNPVAGGKITDLTGLLVSVIKYMLDLVGIVAVLMVIYGGYELVLSSGDADGQKKGKQTITYAIAGLLVAVLSYSIISIVENAIDNQTGTSTTPTRQVAVAGAPGTYGSTGSGTSGSASSASANPASGTSGSGGNAGNGSGNSGVSGTKAPGTTPTTINTNGGASASNPNCTSAAIGYFSVALSSQAPVQVDSANGSAPGSVTYTPTPSNASSSVCSTLPFETFLVDDDAGNGSDEPTTPPSSGQIDSGTGFTENSFAIPANYSQDSNVDVCVFYTSLQPVLSACAIVPIVETSGGNPTNTASNCTAANLAGAVEVNSEDSVDVTDGQSNSIEYTTEPSNSAFANCSLNFETFIFPGSNSASQQLPNDEPDDSGSGFGQNTATIPSEASAGESEITIGVYYTDSSGNSVLGGSTIVSVNHASSGDGNTDDDDE